MGFSPGVAGNPPLGYSLLRACVAFTCAGLVECVQLHDACDLLAGNGAAWRLDGFPREDVALVGCVAGLWDSAVWVVGGFQGRVCHSGGLCGCPPGGSVAWLLGQRYPLIAN